MAQEQRPHPAEGSSKHELGEFRGTTRYVPVRLLGAGGMGAVYEVEDRATGGRVALKVMLADDAGRLLRFKQEFRVMAELYHPNLVRLFDLGQHEGRWFFTMELVHGQDLTEVLLRDDVRGQPTSTAAVVSESLTSGIAGSGDETAVLEPSCAPGQKRVACDPDALVGVVGQILDALEFLHGRGIVHRDLKPSNILVDLDGTVRLLDFGLASRVDRTAAISQEGTVVGTFAYLSPEQYRGEPASAATDLYALGCMMFQLLAGELPFQGSPREALSGRVERPPPRLEDRVSDVPPALAALTRWLMARDPAERPGIAHVRVALGVRAGQRSTPPPELEGDGDGSTSELFIGRQRELSILAGCLERAAGGHATLALISGPSGIGKSALASMAARRAARRGFLCLNGRCYEREQVPFAAFDRLMDEVTLTLRSWSAADLAALRPSLLLLERIFPALGMLTGDRDEPPAAPSGLDPRELHRQAFDGFRRMVAFCQARAPLCFVLDDLQWADEESMALLETLLEDGAGRILVLGLFRSDRIGEGYPLHWLLRRAVGAERATTLPLAALSEADAVHLVEASGRGLLGPGMSEALASQAQGNPFLARRLAKRLASLTPAEQTARLGAVVTADDVLREMVQTLSPRAEQVLALAATAGGDIAAPLLRETSGLGGEEFDLAVGELMAGRFFKAVPRRAEAGGSAGRASPGVADLASLNLDLYHDRIREVAYQGLDEDRRRELHRKLGLAIEARPSGPERDAEALVHHFGGAGDRARRRRYAVEAAEQAAAKLAFVRAAGLFRVALDDPEPGEDVLVTARRWERAGDLFEYGGRHPQAAQAYQEALRRWDEVPEGLADRPVARLRLRGLAGANLMATERVGEARQMFESGLALLGRPLDRPGPSRVAVLASLWCRTALAERLADLPLLARVAPKRGARGSGGPLLAAEVRFLDLLVRAFQPLWPAPAAEAALRAELLGRHLDDRNVLFRSLAFGAVVPVFLGKCSPAQLDRAHLRLDEADLLARAHDVPLGREIVQLNRSLLWLATDMVRARRTCEAALRGFAQRGMLESFDGDVARAYYVQLLLGKGDDDDALLAIDRELAQPHQSFINVGIALSQKVRLLARRGLLADARAVLARCEAHLVGGPPSRLDFFLGVSAASVKLAEGRFAEALAEGEVVERTARESGVWAMALDRSVWLDVKFDAALGVLRRQGLSPPDRRGLRSSAEWLARHGIFDFGCLGHRALALLDHAEGRPRDALRALRRALSLSSSNTNPHRRWLCLLAARDLGTITLDQETEAAELAAAGKFVLPADWA